MKESDTYGSGNFIKADASGCIAVPGTPYELTGTIASLETTEFKANKPGEAPRKQRVLEFKEHGDLRLGLNKTNWRAIARFTGKDDDDDWIGEKIEMFVVPEEQSQTGHAIRVRKPRAPATPIPQIPAGRILGNEGAGRLTKRLSDEKRNLDNLRIHLKMKFPNFATVLNGDPPNWPAEVGTTVAAWFAVPGPSMSEDDIPFDSGPQAR